MRKVREVLRLKHAVGLTYREISAATGVGKTAVYEYIRRAEAIGITWPVAEERPTRKRLARKADVGHRRTCAAEPLVSRPRDPGEKRAGPGCGRRKKRGRLIGKHLELQ
jgi:hypothetical protein